ncbi:MAG: transcriptional regulator [Candidatus Lokiarchaeota archaeon]|nr:transcriptional regulator [Candidatus Lokiarchaeota archaeon]
MNDFENWKTRREKLLERLENMKEIQDLRSIMREMEYPNKKVLISDIAHVAKSLGKEGKQILVLPSSCGLCGYIFNQKGFELKIPSKCPKCKGERINWPSLKIEE